MDPNAAYDLLVEALRNGYREEAREYARNLRDWISRGGFPPDAPDAQDKITEALATYESIIFLQGEEAAEPLDLLYGWTGDRLHIHYTGVTAEGFAAALDYLKQWDYGEREESRDTPDLSGGDHWTEGEYILTAHLGLSQIGLQRIVNGE